MQSKLGLKMILNSTHLKNSMNSSDMQSSRYPSMLGNSMSSTSRHSPTDMPGPSGIAPVQHAPLVSERLSLDLRFSHSTDFTSQSLKKESDWDRSDDKESTSSDYRHSHEMVSSESDKLLFFRKTSYFSILIV